MRLGDLADDREPEPGAGHAPRGSGSVEAVEHVRQVLLVDPGTVVAHRHLAVANGDLDLAAGRAPLGRVVEQVRDRALDRRRDAVDDRLPKVGREGDARPVPACALDGVRGEEVEPHLLRLRRLPLAARELDQLGDEGRHLVQLLDDVSEQPLTLARRQRALARQHLDVRSQARERRPQLVRRVGDELALRAGRLLERAEHRVEARREPAELVVAGGLDALGQVAGGRDGLRRGRQPPHRGERGARDEKAERRGKRDAGRSDREQDRPDPVQRAVDVGERAHHLERRAWDVPHREHPDVDALDMSVANRLAASLGSDRAILVVDREGDGHAEDRQRAAVGVHELRVGRVAEFGLQVPVGARDVVGREPREVGCARAQAVVDRPAKLAAGDDVDHRGGDHDRERDGRSGDEGETRAKAHASRRAYPTPRTVWISRGLPPASVLRRR